MGPMGPMGPMADYVLVDISVLDANTSTIAHEIAHACGLWHSAERGNLAIHQREKRGDSTKWFRRTTFAVPGT